MISKMRYVTKIYRVIWPTITQLYNSIWIFATVTVLTENGHVCKFPFKHEAGEKALYKCTNEGTSVTGMLHEGNDLWCAISVNEDMTYDAWDWCLFNW